jgi:hypothetical protein
MRGLAGNAGFSIAAALLAVVLFGEGGGETASNANTAGPSVHSVGPSRAGTAPGGGGAPDRKASAESPEHASDTNKAASKPCDGGERLIAEFLHLYGDRFALQHLIVLVPDPAESVDAELFDSVLEGVEEAVSDDTGEGTAYVRDRRWMPWTDAPGSECWEEVPGVTLYRPLDGPDAHAPLLVLFVGETPISGLRAPQFKSAVALARRYNPLVGSRWLPFRVLGPTYSGTAASLVAATRSVMRDRSLAGSHFHIVSGTAATVKARQILAPQPQSTTDPYAQLEPQSEVVAYESATATDTYLLRRLQDFLVKRGGDCREGRDGTKGNIVLFTETATTYGSFGTESGCFRIWKLPPDLASIRANAKGSKEPAGGSDDSDNAAEAQVVRRSLALGSTLDRLSDSRIRFAGIVATDPRDVLFLARRFREQLPDIRLFTVGASIRYEDAKEADALNGMLVVHSAPRDQDGPPEWRRDRSVPLRNHLVRKVYYAGRRLLTGRAFELDVQVSFIGNGRLWQVDDFDAARGELAGRGNGWRPPPFGWRFVFAFFATTLVAVVVVIVLAGRRKCSRPRGRLWTFVAPCAHLDLRSHDHAISAGLGLVCAGPVLLMMEGMFARQGHAPGHWQACVAVSIVVVLVAWFFHVWRCDWEMRLGLARHGKVDRRRGLVALRTIGSANLGRFLLALLPITAPTVVLTLALYVGCGPERRATLHLLSGGSPVLVGLIAMGSYALALWCARTRLRMLDTHRFHATGRARFADCVPPIAEALGEEPGQGTGLADIEKRVLNALSNPWREGRVFLLVVLSLMVATIGVPILIKPPHTFEPGWRNHALVAMAIVASLPAAINMAWFLTVWARFKRFLRRLATSPAVAVLPKLPGRRVRPLDEQLAWSGSEGTAEAIQLAYAVDMLERLAAAEPGLEETHRQCRELLTRDLSAEARCVEAVGPRLVDLLLATSARETARRGTVDESTRALIDEFAASLVDVFIPRYVRHFRLFLPPMVVGCMFCVFALSLYFAQPQRLIASIALLWTAATVAVAIISYISLDVDPVLSAVAGSTSGRISPLALARRIVVWGAVPVASYLAVEHPEFPLWVSRILDFIGKSLR